MGDYEYITAIGSMPVGLDEDFPKSHLLLFSLLLSCPGCFFLKPLKSSSETDTGVLLWWGAPSAFWGFPDIAAKGRAAISTSGANKSGFGWGTEG